MEEEKRNVNPSGGSLRLKTRRDFFSLGEMKVLCHICESPIVGEFGSRKRKKGRVEAFQCKIPGALIYWMMRHPNSLF
ncbi:MAG: hypothetical protein ACTSXH_06405 [Promethearchaeota archaeon]